MQSLKSFNQQSQKNAAIELSKCCGSQLWVDLLMAFYPFENETILLNKSIEVWYKLCERNDYLEAFSHHPKIGDVKSLTEKFATTKEWAANEQQGVNTAQKTVIEELVRLNEAYFQKFGYIFIVCATGKSAKEMLQLLTKRLQHTEEEELEVAKGEQFKITVIRLKKIIKFETAQWHAASQVTTHVLDTSLGKPGREVCIKLKQFNQGKWCTISLGFTDADGRIPDLLPVGKNLKPGNYQMCFDTKRYFEQQEMTGFYPSVDINFTIFDESHYHVPLLINPFGYSTYRGS